MDMKQFLGYAQKSVPWLAAAATGNVPAIMGLAVKAIGDATGTTPEATPDGIVAAIAGATPEQMLQLQTANDNFRLQAQQLGYTNAQELAKINLQEEALMIDDVKDARSHANKELYDLAFIIVGGFILLMAMVLYGCFEIISGGITIKDPTSIAIVSGLVGTVVGALGGQSQTVMNFLYGGSIGSRNNGAALADATKTAINQLGNNQVGK